MTPSDLTKVSVIQPAAMKLKDAAYYLGLSTVTLRRLVVKGRIKRHPAVRHLLLTRTSLDSFLAEADAKS